MDVKATLETRVSKKGTEYTAVVVQIYPGLEKLVFLSDAELTLMKAYYKKEK